MGSVFEAPAHGDGVGAAYRGRRRSSPALINEIAYGEALRQDITLPEFADDFRGPLGLMSSRRLDLPGGLFGARRGQVAFQNAAYISFFRNALGGGVRPQGGFAGFCFRLQL